MALALGCFRLMLHFNRTPKQEPCGAPARHDGVTGQDHGGTGSRTSAIVLLWDYCRAMTLLRASPA